MESAKKEKIAPAQKSVPNVGGIKEGGHEHLTTPKQNTNGEVPWGKASNESIL